MPIAMILAAGKGERMKPLTDYTPKPLLPIAGKPLIVWHLEKLLRSGFGPIVINHAHLGSHIEEVLGNGASFDTEIRYSREGEPLETAGGIATALPLIDTDVFAVINGDIYSDYDFRLLAQRIEAMRMDERLAHLVMVDNPQHHPQGDFVLNGDLLNDGVAHANKLTYAGMAVFRRDLFSGVEPGRKAPLAPLLRAAMKLGKVGGEHYTGRWVDVGTPERLWELDRIISGQMC